MPSYNITAITAYINVLRAIHHAPPLIPTAKLNGLATNWSTYMAATNRFDHSPYPYGENIGYVGPSTNFTDAAITVVNMCYAEFPTWNKTKTPNSAGHFTQLVWYSTRYIGIGVVGSSKRTYITFEFDPPGNVWGQYTSNVF